MVFLADMDGTMIYSKRYDIGESKICVEYKNGQELSYMTQKSWDKLQKFAEKNTVIPITTRSVEQFLRINDFGVKYALTCNGGVLLVDGEIDPKWRENSLEIVDEVREELDNVLRKMQDSPKIIPEIRWVDNMFLYVISNDPLGLKSDLERVLDLNKVDVHTVGKKVYVMPKRMSKGYAVARLREWLNFGEEKIVCAGDTRMDISMAEVADVMILPKRLNMSVKNAIIMPENGVYSDEIFEKIWANEEGEYAELGNGS